MIKLIYNRKFLLSLILIIVSLLMILAPDLLLASGVDDGGADKTGSNWLEKTLWTIVNVVFGGFLYLAGMLLNEAITTYVVGFSDVYQSTGLGFAVDNLWRTVRDIFNLTFIFGLVYIGFKMILNAGDTNARRMLVYIILAALLVNFSMFFSKFIIDFSNIAATQVAQAFPQNGDNKYAVADSFMDAFGFSGIWTSQGTGLAQGSGGFLYIFLTMILFIITTFVFFAGGLLLIIRFVVLNLFIILSPIMFLGWVFPNLSSYSTLYWRSFLGRAFFAPAYIFMLYLSYTVFKEFSHLTNTPELTNLASGVGNTSAVFDAVIPYFLIMSVFLIASIVIGQKMGADGAGAVINIGRNISGRTRKAVQQGAGSITFGLAAKTAQNTAGRTAAYITQKDGVKAWASKNFATRGIYKAGKGVADASFDARRVGGWGTAAGIGGGKAGGYATQVKEAEKRDTEFVKTLEKNTRDQFGEILPEVAKEISERVVAAEKDLNTNIRNAELEIKAVTDKVNKDENRVNIEKIIQAHETKLKTIDSKDVVGINTLNKEIETEKAKLAKIDKRIQDETKPFVNNLNEANKALTDFNKTGRTKMKKDEESRIKYANVVKHRESREREAKRAVTVAVATGAATAGAVGVVLGAPLLAVGAGMVALANSYKRGEHKAQISALGRDYGRDGIKKAEKEQHKYNMRILAEAQKEAGVTPESNASDQNTSTTPPPNP